MYTQAVLLSVVASLAAASPIQVRQLGMPGLGSGGLGGLSGLGGGLPGMGGSGGSSGGLGGLPALGGGLPGMGGSGSSGGLGGLSALGGGLPGLGGSGGSSGGLGGLSALGGGLPGMGGSGSSGGLGGLLGRGTGSTSNEFSQGGCKDILFAFARGSTEIGNMGTTVGPPTADGLKKNFGADKVAAEGIGYAASIGTNAIPGGTDRASAKMMSDTLTSMSSKCPDSVIVAAGYSQGAAVCHRGIEGLPNNVKAQIAGVVTYGDTQKTQDRNQIPNFPPEKLKIICQPGDAVCQGTLSVLPAHLTYGSRVNEGVEFLTQQIKAAQSKIKTRNAKREAEKMVPRMASEIKKVAVHTVA